jgi:LmbE family N-acetylglucosaminyl deacetylase
MKKRDAKVLTRKQKFLRSLLRIFGTVFLILFGVYFWNPQRVHFGEPKKMPPINHGITEANFIKKDTRVTVVVGHPDDAEFYISGTLLKLHEAGAKITLILVTDGDKGYYPFFLTDAAENRRVRRQEQRDASAAYGAELVFLGGPDGRYDPDEPTLRAKLLEVMKASKPDYVLTFDAECIIRVQHRDHENAGRAATELAGETTAKALLLFAGTSPNFVVDTSKYWPTREKLLAIHKSQFYDDKLEMIKGMVYSRTIDAAEDYKFELGEAYRVVPLRP